MRQYGIISDLLEPVIVEGKYLPLMWVNMTMARRRLETFGAAASIDSGPQLGYKCGTRFELMGIIRILILTQDFVENTGLAVIDQVEN